MEIETQLTAVEWLEVQIKNTPTVENLMNQLDAFIKEAKEMDKEQKIAFGKKCFYKGFEKAENDDANCFTAWREEATGLLISKSE